MAGHRNNRNNLVLLSALSLLVLTVIVTQVSSSPFYLGTVFAAPGDIGDPPALCNGVPSNLLTSNLVSASSTISGNIITYKFSSADESSSGGIPGLMAYCVYANTNPTSTTANAIGADGSLFKTGIKPTKFFGYGRSDGDPSNLPLDGTQNVQIGTADFGSSSNLPTSPKIILHINDAAECDRLYGGNPGTCFVLPGTITQHLIVHKVTIPSSDTSTPFTITASATTGTIDTTQITITGGSSHDYSVTPGTYSVSETPPGGGWVKDDSQCQGIVVPVGQTKECTITNTFTAPPPPSTFSISGMKFEDMNANGAKDQGDDGLEGWTINLLDSQGNPVATTTTAADGTYHFDNLQPGTYTLTETQQTGWMQTAPNPNSISVTITNADVTDQDFGNFKLGSISGMKFEDMNANGAKDQGDNGLEGWTINISGPDSFSASATTDGTGAYTFDNLKPGEYTITETQQTGWMQTAPNPTTITVTIDTSGQVVTDQDFGNFKLGEIIVTKFYDANANGVFDSGDTPINGGTSTTGWKVGVTDTSYNQVGYTQFDTTPVLLPDTYTVNEFSSSIGQWFKTTPGTYSVPITEGSVVTKDFGNVCTGAGGGLTLGFWSNKNGQALINSGDLIMLSGLNLKNADGTDFNPTTAAQVSTWLLNANAKNMANMLSAQLAAMELNVAHGKVSGTSLVYAPGELNANTAGFITVNQLMSDANSDLGMSGHNITIQSGPVRTYQELMKTALDKGNNNLNFAQSTPCAFSFP